jgi:hypothetical protein
MEAYGDILHATRGADMIDGLHRTGDQWEHRID